MTKIYDIIHLNGQSYMVDKEAEISDGDWYIHNNKVIQAYKSSEELRNIMKNLCAKILASTDTSLGLPLLPAFEENIEELAKKTLGYTPISLLDISNFKAGYKAAKVKMAQQVEVQIDENGDIEIKDGFVIVKSWISRTFVE